MAFIFHRLQKYFKLCQRSCINFSPGPPLIVISEISWFQLQTTKRRATAVWCLWLHACLYPLYISVCGQMYTHRYVFIGTRKQKFIMFIIGTQLLQTFPHEKILMPLWIPASGPPRLPLNFISSEAVRWPFQPTSHGRHDKLGLKFRKWPLWMRLKKRKQQADTAVGVLEPNEMHTLR